MPIEMPAEAAKQSESVFDGTKHDLECAAVEEQLPNTPFELLDLPADIILMVFKQILADNYDFLVLRPEHRAKAKLLPFAFASNSLYGLSLPLLYNDVDVEQLRPQDDFTNSFKILWG